MPQRGPPHRQRAHIASSRRGGRVSGEVSTIVTVLFTDQVHSTEQSQRLGDDAADVLRRAHFSLLRDALTQHRGEEVKTIGDSLMVVFPSALDALACAVAIQQAVERFNRSQPPERLLHIRVGLDAGEPSRSDRDYFGTPVVVARRLCDSAVGGQIITSDLVRRLAGTRGGHTFSELGT